MTLWSRAGAPSMRVASLERAAWAESRFAWIRPTTIVFNSLSYYFSLDGHGGRIWGESEGVGKGTTFHVVDSGVSR